VNDGQKHDEGDQWKALPTVTSLVQIKHARITGNNGVTTTFALDLNAGLTQVLSDGTNTYLYGNGRIGQFSEVDSAYFLGDALGSVRQLADENGVITLSKAYEPYGEVMVSTGSGSSIYGFTGESQSGNLVYLRARYYQSDSSRFLTRDSWQGNYTVPASYNFWLYGYSNPINRIDPSGLFSVDTIKNSLEGKTLSEVFGRERYGVPRWGLYALLKDAKEFDHILLRTLDFSYEGNYYPLAPDPGGEWHITSECEKLKFWNKDWGEVSLLKFIDIVNLKAETRSNLSDKWWRPATLQFHWYQGNQLYSDFYKGSHIPDLYMMGAGATIKVVFGVNGSLVYDRYGNQYFSVSGSFGGFSFSEAWEGYATYNGTPRRWETIPGEEMLRSTIIEGWSVGATGSLVGFGGGMTGWRLGSVTLFGGVNGSLGASISVGYTWKTGNDVFKTWAWVDDEIPTYGPQK